MLGAANSLVWSDPGSDTDGVEVGGMRGAVVTYLVIVHQYKQDKCENTFDLGELLFHCFFLQAPGHAIVSNPGKLTLLLQYIM